MGEKEKSSKKFITKEPIITAVIGLVVGIILTCVVCLIARTRGMANLRYGKDAIASVAGKSILTEKVYETIKPNYGLSALIDQVDKAILNEKYTLTEKEEKDVSEDLMKDMGKVMKLAKEKCGVAADGRDINEIVKKYLTKAN